MADITVMLDKIEGDLGVMESRQASVSAGRSILRKVDRLVKDLDEFEKTYFEPKVAYDLSWADSFETELNEGSVEGVGVHIDELRGALKAAQLIGLSEAEVERGNELVARFEALSKGSKGAKGSSFAPGSARNLGVPIHVTCGCGDFESVSNQGDWSSIRYAAKVHAETCKTANPGSDDSLTNDLDRVRTSIVAKRQGTTSGGLTFTVGE